MKMKLVLACLLLGLASCSERPEKWVCDTGNLVVFQAQTTTNPHGKYEYSVRGKKTGLVQPVAFRFYSDQKFKLGDKVTITHNEITP